MVCQLPIKNLVCPRFGRVVREVLERPRLTITQIELCKMVLAEPRTEIHLISESLEHNGFVLL